MYSSDWHLSEEVHQYHRTINTLEAACLVNFTDLGTSGHAVNLSLPLSCLLSQVQNMGKFKYWDQYMKVPILNKFCSGSLAREVQAGRTQATKATCKDLNNLLTIALL